MGGPAGGGGGGRGGGGPGRQAGSGAEGDVVEDDRGARRVLTGQGEERVGGAGGDDQVGGGLLPTRGQRRTGQAGRGLPAAADQDHVERDLRADGRGRTGPDPEAQGLATRGDGEPRVVV